MHAFGLEECGNYVDSEKEARQVLQFLIIFSDFKK